LDYSPTGIAELSKFAKSAFDVDHILQQAERLKYVSAIKKVLSDWVDQPSDSLTKLIAGEVYDGRLTQQVRETIAAATSAAFKELIRDRLRTRISSALEDPEADVPDDPPLDKDAGGDNGIETTQEEVEGWLTIKAILRDDVSPARIGMRDAKSYCAILLDDNNRKPLARLHFNGARKKYLGLFDGEKEDRVEIDSLNDLFAWSDRLKATAAKYDG
jgi:hypothetical protein